MSSAITEEFDVSRDGDHVGPHLIVPGWAGSGPTHWQSVWEQELRALRVELADWYAPHRATWVAALDEAVARIARVDPRPPILVAHSLGCVAVAHWAAASSRPIRAALLVAPADVECAAPVRALSDFAPLPYDPLPFPSALVTSDDDPVISVHRARALAALWGSQLHVIAGGGHLNAESGLGCWPDGRSILAALDQRV